PRAATESTGNVIVKQAGIYPFRLVYWQQAGGASVEWYVVDSAGTRTLINDLNAPAASQVKAYRALKAGVAGPAPYLSAASPAPGDVDVSTQPQFELDITDDSTSLDPTSVQLTINGTTTIVATNAITKTGNVSVVKPTLSAALSANTVQQVRVDFKDN